MEVGSSCQPLIGEIVESNDIQEEVVIWNYGLHWREDCVWWGSSGRAGCLYGATNRNAPQEQAVDFRNQVAIYALYANYDLIYVGQAGTGNNRLFNRLNAHRSDHLSERWDRFFWFGARLVTEENKLGDYNTIRKYTGFSNNAPQEFMASALNIFEAVLIAVSEPRLNLRRGNWGQEVIPQYYQWWDGKWWNE